MDWGDPFQSAWQNISGGASDVEGGIRHAGGRFQQYVTDNIPELSPWSPKWAGKFLGLGGVDGNGGGGGGQNWFGYMPEYLKEADVSLKNLMSGGAANDPYIKNLQDIYKQNVRGAQAERGGFYGGKAIEEEASGMSQIYQQAANQEMQNYLNYLGLARPQALTPQPQQPGFGSYLGQGLGTGLGMGAASLLSNLL